jgi:hypothetical protein
MPKATRVKNTLPIENHLPDVLPRLTSFGRDLDLSPATFGELESSSHLLNDAQALRAKMQADGYLFLPGYLNREDVLQARAEVAARLEREGVLDPNFPRAELVARRKAAFPMRPDLVRENAPLLKVLYDGPMIAFYEKFFGEAVRHFDYTWFRAVLPGRGTPPHMDIVYMGRGTHELLTAWTPLGDVSLQLGGLMILEKSHLHERLNRNYAQRDVDRVCTNKTRADGQPIQPRGYLSDFPDKLRANLGGRWLTARFRAGDLLTFTSKTIHASLDNASNQIRLSTDTRYQPAAAPIDDRWIGENPTAHGPQSKREMIC